MMEELLFEMRRTKRLGDRALAQLEEADWSWRPDAEANSIAIIVQHLHGNMLSRWTDFLVANGEKPTRDRDGEFEPKALLPEDLLARWEEGWRVCLGAIEPLADADLACTVKIRDEPLSVLVRQGLEQDSVDDAEDRGVRADAESESQNGQRGVARTLDERTGRVADVVTELVEPVHRRASPAAGREFISIHRYLDVPRS